MDIPIQNLYYLLCYAWNKLEERDIVDVDPIESATMADLFARVLVSGTNHLLKRGFDRSYVAHRAKTSRLRGRIRFDTVAKAGALSATLPCEFDELSYDILHNQILKATSRQLIRVGQISKANVEALSGVTRQLAEVRDIEVTSRVFGQVQLHRNNRFYDFLLKICELIHHNLLISEKAGYSRFRDFHRDERQMRVLYEDFVRNFYDRHTTYGVRRENLEWGWTAEDAASDELLPRMQTDVSLERGDRKIIIECKYMPDATQHNHEATKLRSDHLYQLNAYLDNVGHAQCEGILLYPTVGAPLSASYARNAHRIRIRTIDLNQPWQGIHEDLLQLVA